MEWRLILPRAEPRMYIILIVIFTIFQVTLSSRNESRKCLGTVNTFGITIPTGDIVLQSGSPLEIFCILHKADMERLNISSKDLYFIRKNQNISEEWVTIVNDTTIKLYVENVPPSNDMYICKVRDEPVCINTVIVDTKPGKVDNFSCISYNYENLVCTWVAPRHYAKTTYNLTYSFPGRSSRGLFICPSMTVNGSLYSCKWDLSTVPQYRQAQPTYHFQLNINNTFGFYSQKEQFDHFAHVQPDPPEKLQVINKTSSSVYLNWTIKPPMINFPKPLYHRVVYQSEYDTKDVWHVANTTSLIGQKTPVFNLTGLQYAHVLYDIRVSIRSIKAQENDEKLWSKNVSLTVRTASTVPGAPPRVNIGSFEFENNRTGRDILVYWEWIPEYMKNGENFSYKVLVYEENTIEKKIEPVDITSTYAKFVSLSLKSYRFEIISTNEIGRSVNSSSIYVPSVIDRVPEPTKFTKISFGKQVYELSWKEPESPRVPIKNYTIYYCRNDYDRPFQCKGYLQWVEVVNATMKNITVPEDRVYQFAISANTENASSGMVWASCTIIHHKEFTKIKSLWIDRIGSDYIEISWKLDCSDRIGNIEGYIIYYCPIVSPVDINCNGEERNVTIEGDLHVSRGTVRNLKPYTTYMLTVSVKSIHNTGLPSDPLYNTTLEGAPDPPGNVTITNITSSSMVVQWSPPKAMNGVLRYYQVVYSHNGKETKLKPADDKDTMIKLTNLSSYTEYNITVYASTQHDSKPSELKTVKTSISVPGKMHSPNVKFQNESTILVAWSPPDNAGGKLDRYQLRIKEKINSENKTRIINTTDLQWDVPDCGNDKTYKVLYFSIRAINYDTNSKKEYVGDWSPESENYCQAPPRMLIWIIIVIGVCFLGCAFWILRKLWYRCKMMREIEVKLPPGLAPVISELDMKNWPVQNIQKSSSNEDPLMHMRANSSADEELLLAKKAECGDSHDRITSGDSSGCSSGHESVTSSLASGTNLSSTSDSGTEQPRTPSSESASRENSLRQRRTGSESMGWDTEIVWPKSGYVPMPTDKSLSPQNWNAAKPVPANNYCVLGVDNIVQQPSEINNHSGYVPVSLSIPHNEQTKNIGNKAITAPYVSCDSIFNKDKQSISPLSIQQQQSPQKMQAPPYVKTSDVALMGRNAQLQPAIGGKNMEQPTDTNTSVVISPTYVMAGGPISCKGRPYVKGMEPDITTGKLINIEPINEVDTFIQHTSEIDAPVVLGTTDLKGSIDDRISSPEHEISAISGYVKTEDILGLKDNIENRGNRSRRGSDETAQQQTQQLQQSQQLQQPNSLNSYCRLGWDRNAGVEHAAPVSTPVLRKTSVEPTSTKGYVPHRQFENKTLKED